MIKMRTRSPIGICYPRRAEYPFRHHGRSGVISPAASYASLHCFASADGKLVTFSVGHSPLFAPARVASRHAVLIRFDCSWPDLYGIIAGYWVDAPCEGTAR